MLQKNVAATWPGERARETKPSPKESGVGIELGSTQVISHERGGMP